MAVKFRLWKVEQATTPPPPASATYGTTFAKPTSNHHHSLSAAPCASFSFWTLCEGPALFQRFAQSAACPGSTSTENYGRFSPPFYPMTSQDTMRPFCLFSQIRVRSHTNTNINILSSEWATKYLVGSSHESVFARFVMIYCELKRTRLHCAALLT